ncbi:prepilin-type N-terminal cleavage/methylation domain-containing protein [Oceanithermus sp.]|uniref:prepilin-type N-terminal cleavage/methylation domain-containing protein n=1 Tax=Oceanithermus sp. TaxID=2268145 RepID=UPI00257F2E3B|nr:prepilin-type N-terminal cleavage/methylation domain-containing protein [Oceanithermus sp.]
MRRRAGFTLVEVTVALVLLSLAAAAVIAALLGAQRTAFEARRLGVQLAALENASEHVQALQTLPSGESACPGVRREDYPELGGFRCVVRRAPGERVVEIALLDEEGDVFAATLGVLR